MSPEQSTPNHTIPPEWSEPLLDALAKRGSGHTPDKKRPEYWNGPIPWLSLRDSDALDRLYVEDTAATITAAGIANSSATEHPAGTVVLSRDAGVGKSAIMKRSMAVSQHFVAWQCGSKLANTYLYYWLQWKKPEFERIAMGSTIKTIGLPYFQSLRVTQPPIEEQARIATALLDVDKFIAVLDALIAKRCNIKQAAMQQLLSGRERLKGFRGRWTSISMENLGYVYGGLAGKDKRDFGSGNARFIPFMNIMSNTVIDTDWMEAVSVEQNEAQNRVKKGDLFFNGSSETSEEVGYCSVLLSDVENVYLNSFSFGFRFHQHAKSDGRFFAYWFRSHKGREAMAYLAQGATRYNIAKRAFMKLEITLPGAAEQAAIADVLSDLDAEIRALEYRRAKALAFKHAMAHQLFTGRIRLV